MNAYTRITSAKPRAEREIRAGTEKDGNSRLLQNFTYSSSVRKMGREREREKTTRK